MIFRCHLCKGVWFFATAYVWAFDSKDNGKLECTKNHCKNCNELCCIGLRQ